jgi:hypothetical protein
MSTLLGIPQGGLYRERNVGRGSEAAMCARRLVAIADAASVSAAAQQVRRRSWLGSPTGLATVQRLPPIFGISEIILPPRMALCSLP